MSQIKIIPSSILSVPLQNYAKDFVFIVNGKEFSTSRVFSDMISRKISLMHFQDPTIDTYTINTHHFGDFSHFLDLISFKEVTIPDEEIDFLIEVIEELGNESIEIIGAQTKEGITNDNVFNILRTQSKFSKFYSENIDHEVDYISTHFYELNENKKEEMLCLPKDILSRIISNPKLQLESEDELIEFVNELYSNNNEFSILYEFVEFEKVSVESITHFIEVFDYNELTNSTWLNLTKRLLKELKDKQKSSNCKKCKPFTSEISKTNDGILSLLKKNEKTPFDRLFIASQSSNDIYNVIDPNTNDSFGLNNIGNFVEIELEEPVDVTGIKIFSSNNYFPKTFDIIINDDQVQSIKKANKLNGVNRSMTVLVNSEKCRKVRFINRGTNWDFGSNCVNIKRIELLSNDPRYEGGVLSTLVSKSEKNDPHKCPVILSASYYDFNTFHTINTSSNTCTFSIENSWFQIELVQGSAIFDGFRLRKCELGKMRNFKIICTDDVNKEEKEWTTLIRINEQNEGEYNLTDIYKFEQQSPPSKYIRLIETGPNWDGNWYLQFYHFDLFGKYLS